MSKQELINKRVEVWEKAKAFVNERADKNTGKLSGEDRTTYENMETEIAELTDAIKREERAEMIDAQLSLPTSTPVHNSPMTQKAVEEEEKGVSSKAYKSDLLSHIRARFRTPITNIMQEQVAADGGYLVPTEMDKRLIQELTGRNVMRQLATIITTESDHEINVANTKLTGSWVGEAQQIQFSQKSFSQVLLKAFKLVSACKITEELLQDSAFDLESRLIEDFADAISNAEEDAFLNGDGTGKPRGLFDATTGATIADTLALPSDLTVDKIIDLVYALERPYRKNASFITNDKTVAEIRKFKDQNGAFIWQPALMPGEPDRILGYPLYTSQYAPEMVSGNTFIAFGDMKYYNIGDRGSRTFQRLEELYAETGMFGMLCKERVDGVLTLRKAVRALALA